MTFNWSRFLILAPHTDDGEFGCGGTVSKLLEAGGEVRYVAFSTATQSVPDDWPSDVLEREVRNATQVLGIPSSNLIVLDYPVRNFHASRQAILEDMIRMKEEFKPEVVFLPSMLDTHQDHQVVAMEGFRAFKQTTILGYELPWNNLTFDTNFFISLEERHVRKKQEALRCYESQQSRPYASPDFIRSLAITRGVQISRQYAEVFQSVRFIWC